MPQKKLQAIYESIITEQSVDSNSFGYRAGKFASKIPGYAGRLVGTAGKLAGVEYDDEEDSVGNFYGKHLGKYFRGEFKKIFKAPGDFQDPDNKSSKSKSSSSKPAGRITSKAKPVSAVETNTELKNSPLQKGKYINKADLINIGAGDEEIDRLKQAGGRLYINDKSTNVAIITFKNGGFYVSHTSYGDTKLTPKQDSLKKL